MGCWRFKMLVFLDPVKLEVVFKFYQLITRVFSSLDGSDVSLVSSMPVVCVTACCEWERLPPCVNNWLILFNIVQSGWSHQASGGFRTLTLVQCSYLILQAKMWEVDLQNPGVLCISSSPFHVLALELNDPSPRRLVSIGLRCITWTPLPVASTTRWHCGFKKRRRTKPLPAPWKRNRRWDEARLGGAWGAMWNFPPLIG